MKTLSLKKKRKLILLLVFGLITVKCFEFYEAYDYMVNTILHMGWIWLDAYHAKKGSLFLELWTIIVDTLKWVDSKTKCFLASFS